MPSSPTIASRLRALLPAALGVGLTLLAGEASAVSSYVIRDPIHQHLERTGDDHGLCRREGVSMNQLVLFVPGTRGSVSVYWVRARDRFVQYPGTTACVVWKRLGQ